MIKLTTETGTYYLDKNEFLDVCLYKMRDIEPVQKIEFNDKIYEFNPPATSLIPQDIKMNFDAGDIIATIKRNTDSDLAEIARDVIELSREIKEPLLDNGLTLAEDRRFTDEYWRKNMKV